LYILKMPDHHNIQNHKTPPLIDERWVLRGRRVILPDGIRPASIVIQNGLIQEIAPFNNHFHEDVGDLVIMPGLVDTHVHINEPGRTDWEGFESATLAAAAGGITTIIDMPLNSIPVTTSVAALEKKIASAEGKCWVDIGFWGGIVPGNSQEVEPLLCAGCLGFKCFLTPSGVDEFAHLVEDDLWKAMREVSRTGSVLLVHAELADFLASIPDDQRKYMNYMNSRPSVAENSAIELLLHLCAETGCNIHIVHLSSAEALEFLQTAREQRLPMTVETCPHYLTFAAEDIPDGATEFKCSPPIRPASNRESLWDGLRDGIIDMIVSDHSPCPSEMKHKETGDFGAAWGGIASLQFALPVVWTAASGRGFGTEEIVRWMSSEPSVLAGLSGQKGAISPGCDADLVVWNPDEEFTVRPEFSHHRHKLTPYAGRRLRGVVKRTYLRGQAVSPHDKPRGKILRNRNCAVSQPYSGFHLNE
jgi:allantoinase